MGDVLFWVMQRVLGRDAYNLQLHLAWVKIYSRMLRTIVPVAVAMELKDGSAQVSRLTVHETKMFEESQSRHSSEPTTKDTVSAAKSSVTTESAGILEGSNTYGSIKGGARSVLDPDHELTCERIRNSPTARDTRPPTST